MSDEAVEPATLLTVDEVASQLRLSRSKVYILIQSGKLTAYRMPAIRVSHQDLREFLDNCRTESCRDEPRWRGVPQIKLKHLR